MLVKWIKYYVHIHTERGIKWDEQHGILLLKLIQSYLLENFTVTNIWFAMFRDYHQTRNMHNSFCLLGKISLGSWHNNEFIYMDRLLMCCWDWILTATKTTSTILSFFARRPTDQPTYQTRSNWEGVWE